MALHSVQFTLVAAVETMSVCEGVGVDVCVYYKACVFVCEGILCLFSFMLPLAFVVLCRLKV